MDVWWIAHRMRRFLPILSHHHIVIREDRRADFAAAADEREAVALLAGVEIPDSSSDGSLTNVKHCAGDVLDRVALPGVDCEAGDLRDASKQEVDEIETVRREIEEKTGAGCPAI